MSTSLPDDNEWDNNREIALVDLLDRVLAGGVVISGDVTLSIADVDMVVISLRTLVSSVASLPWGLDTGADHDAT